MAFSTFSRLLSRVKCNSMQRRLDPVAVIPHKLLQLHSSFGTSQIQRSVWDEDWAEPVPDREFYRQNPPMEGDVMYKTNVRAAPTRHYYSVYHDPILEKFEKMILKKGRGDLAYKLLNETLREIKLIQVAKYNQATEEMKDDIETNPLVIFHQALHNAMPVMGLNKVKKGKNIFHVPTPLTDKKKFFITSKWMLDHVRQRRQSTPMSGRLAKEILSAYNNEGVAVKKKQDLHRQVELNRAYVHLRWRG